MASMKSILITFFLCLTLSFGWKVVSASTMLSSRLDTAVAQKAVYIPTKVWRVPANNDYSDSTSEYSNSRRAESANIVLFWAKEYGNRPVQLADASKRFDPEEVLRTCEEFYTAYTQDLKFVEVGNSFADKYKLLMYVFAGDDGTAYGGGAEDKIGVVWTPAARINKKPYGALAHEMGHSFQYLAKCDGHWAYSSPAEGSKGQTIFEMTAQYMLWQVYPNWITFENYHLQGFMEKTHYAFLHETNQYHAPFVLEYWSDLHGVDFVGKMWRLAQRGEDPVLTYKRLLDMDQAHFNDELFAGYLRFITWDLPRIREVSKAYANQHKTKLDRVADNTWRIAPGNAPQNYGYNAIPLAIPDKGLAKISLSFAGKTSLDGYRIRHPEEAGWRYGFLAVTKDGTRHYGDVHQQDKAKVGFAVPAETTHLWLVVMGAPKQHRIHLVDGKEETDEQWPYEIQLTGTSPLSDR